MDFTRLAVTLCDLSYEFHSEYTDLLLGDHNCQRPSRSLHILRQQYYQEPLQLYHNNQSFLRHNRPLYNHVTPGGEGRWIIS